MSNHNAENDSQGTLTQDTIQIRKGAEDYINCFETLTALHEGNKLGFVKAMKLEIERLRLNLPATESDKALSSIGMDPATIDPNKLVEESSLVHYARHQKHLRFLVKFH
uniref:Uncharacterized protein n=1 Tax=Tanacetum cinerariifolium TaxID=118510 RepID=A0A6L2K219_TANCI|nr:hypothetical protein [Tanacetum cinerariifolium]